MGVGTRIARGDFMNAENVMVQNAF